MNPDVENDALWHFTINLLNRWEVGELDELQLVNEAEHQLEMLGHPQFEHHDVRSVAIDVLLNLEMLFAQWMTRHDIPAMREFLVFGLHDPVTAWQRWAAYWEMLDWEQRE